LKKLFLISLLIFSHLSCFATNWIYIENDTFIDDDSITKLKNGDTQIWVMWKLSPDITKNLQNDLRKLGVTTNYEDYSFSKTLFQISCTSRTYTSLSGIDYGLQNRVIRSFNLTVQEMPMQPIAPGTTAMAFYEKICKKKK